MKNTRSNVGVTVLALTSLLASVAMALAPIQVFASEVSVQTVQLLPSNGGNCSQMVSSSITPYIYDGALHSFEFSVPDASYVAVVGSVGNTAVPFQFMTRSTINGALRIHVDIQTTPIPVAGLPVSVTLLSAKTGQPVCATILVANIKSSDGFATITPDGTVIGTSTPTVATPTYTYPSTGGSMKPAHSNGGKVSGSIGGGDSTGTQQGAPSNVTSAGIAKFFESFHNVCSAINGNAVGLWILLLVLFILIIFWAVQMETPVSFMEWGLIPVGMIFIPAILLLIYWFSVPVCRASWFIPVLILFILIVGVVTALRRHPRVVEVWTRVRSTVMPS